MQRDALGYLLVGLLLGACGLDTEGGGTAIGGGLAAGSAGTATGGAAGNAIGGAGAVAGGTAGHPREVQRGAAERLREVRLARLEAGASLRMRAVARVPMPMPAAIKAAVCVIPDTATSIATTIPKPRRARRPWSNR